MKTEFHYYITHLIAARAGFRGDNLRILAYASQFTDDNEHSYPIKSGNKIVYRNQISQTMDPTKLHREKLEVYPFFHFIPGDPNAASARRKDGKINPLNTTPNSLNANRIIDEALKTNDFYQIGIAIHAYVDTWAHQNFVGYKDDFNAFSGGFIDALLPNIGHADAKTKPDQPRLVWNDERLVVSTVNNKARFLDAAGHLFRKLRTLADASCGEDALVKDQTALLSDLGAAIGEGVAETDPSDTRLAGYSELATRNEYGGTVILEYKKDSWFKETIKKTVRRTGSPSHGQQTVETYSFLPNYEQTDWFKFQEAVVAYANRTKAILCETPGIAAAYSA